ncbi:hypothetical protein ATANTOWER_030517 [Ataeniobius toweri]|uniref:Uncharacterized protein n=1 Tax=Ataeniobius toweri TaxID=208326 RepID=A0ABU7BVE7_9TELE|nr:hypothetical protein [Ataeniobius toweri]
MFILQPHSGQQQQCRLKLDTEAEGQRTMRLKVVVVTVLLVAALSYYIYTPLPDAIQEPWKLMVVDAGFRTAMNLATLKHQLGLDHYITSVRHTLEGFDSTVTALQGSESTAGVVPGVKVSDITFARIPVRVYEPPAGGEGHLRRGLMYLHGGGWAFGSGSKHKMGFYIHYLRFFSHHHKSLRKVCFYTLKNVLPEK